MTPSQKHQFGVGPRADPVSLVGSSDLTVVMQQTLHLESLHLAAAMHTENKGTRLNRMLQGCMLQGHDFIL